MNKKILTVNKQKDIEQDGKQWDESLDDLNMYTIIRKFVTVIAVRAKTIIEKGSYRQMNAAAAVKLLVILIEGRWHFIFEVYFSLEQDKGNCHRKAAVFIQRRVCVSNK